MLSKLIKQLNKRLRLRESWVMFFILGIIMMNYPFINIFNKSISFFNMPILFLYLHIGWLISIIVIYLFSKAIVDPEDKQDKGDSH